MTTAATVNTAVTSVRDIPRSILYNRHDKDFSVYVDRQFIGYTRTYLEGETLANETILEWITSGVIAHLERRFHRVNRPSRRARKH